MPQPRNWVIWAVRAAGDLPLDPSSTIWRERTESSPPLKTRETCVDGWVRPRSKWTQPQMDPDRSGGAPPSLPGFPLIDGPNERSSSRRSTRSPVSRLSSTATAESIRSTPSPPALPTGSVSLLSALATTGSSTAAIDETKKPIWRSDMSGYSFCHLSAAEHGIRKNGRCSLPRKSTSFAPAAALSRRSFPIATPAMRSVPTCWTSRGAGLRHEPVSNRGCLTESDSPGSGADGGGIGTHKRRWGSEEVPNDSLDALVTGAGAADASNDRAQSDPIPARTPEDIEAGVRDSHGREQEVFGGRCGTRTHDLSRVKAAL